MGSSKHTARISRRTLMKLIAAAGGSLAASTMLPGEWAKPLLKVGVLPVHAQSSLPNPTYHIDLAVAYYMDGDGCLENMSVSIAPAASGVTMQVQVCDVAGNIGCQTFTADTDAAGLATFDTTSLGCFGPAPIRVTFSFADPADCDGTVCSTEFLFPNWN